MSGFPEYDRYDGLGLAQLVRDGAVSAVELVEEAIARAEALNPALNAIIRTLYEQGRRDAAQRRRGAVFDGVPFVLKDLLHAYAGVPLSSGSRSLLGYVPPEDSHLVRRFRGAGLVVFGKTNVPEFGLVATTEPKVFGPTRNPWDLTRSAGGSSGGSAAAVAAGIVPLASATDGGGSIRIPAAWCGLFGLKPSRGRFFGGPAFGEIWDGAVVDGVLTRSVRDSAAALDVLTATSPGDPYLAAIPGRPFLREVEEAPARLRIAYTTRAPLGGTVHPECRRAVEVAARLLEAAGHALEEAEPSIEAAAVARAYLTMYYGHVAADLRLIEGSIGRRAAREGLEAATAAIAAIGEAIPAAEYVLSKRTWNDFARSMATFHETFDLFLTPTTAEPPPGIASLEVSRVEELSLRAASRLRAGRALRASGVPEKLAFENLAPVAFSQLPNLTGQPAMSVPVHWGEDGLPYGAHFVGRLGDEGLLFRVAAWLEQANPWFHRRPPVAPSQASPSSDAGR